MRNLYIKGIETFADRSLFLSLHTRENEFKDLQKEFKSQIEELNKEQQKNSFFFAFIQPADFRVCAIRDKSEHD